MRASELVICGQGLVTLESALRVVQNLERKIDELAVTAERKSRRVLLLAAALTRTGVMQLQPAQIRILAALSAGGSRTLAALESELGEFATVFSLRVQVSHLRRQLRPLFGEEAVKSLYKIGYVLHPAAQDWVNKIIQEQEKICAI